MCLIAFAWQYHEEYPLIVAANRDEFYKRPTAPADYWEAEPNVLAGKDLKAGGTWMGVSKKGRWSALTNYRVLKNILPNAPSRGELTTNFLTTGSTPTDYLEGVRASEKVYNGYNLLVGNRQELYYHNNVNQEIIKVAPGIHGLSNGLLDIPWPKVELAKEKLTAAINEASFELDHLLEIMIDHQLAPDDQLPSTGVPYEWEKALSSMFITSPEYGTSITTVMRMHLSGKLDFLEFTHPVGGKEGLKKNFELTF